MTVELGYLTLSTPDLERARVFYGALFGWTFAAETAPHYSHVDNTGLPLGFSRGAPADSANLYFMVEDILAALAQVAALGGKAGDPHQSESGLSAACSDDQGSRFSLWQPAPGLAN